MPDDQKQNAADQVQRVLDVLLLELRAPFVQPCFDAFYQIFHLFPLLFEHKSRGSGLSPPPCFSFFRYEGLLSARHDVLILLDDALDVLNVSLHIVLGHGIDFQQHGVVQPLDHLIIGEDLIIQLFQLGNLAASVPLRAMTKHGCGSRVALGANALNACEGAVFDGLVVECADHDQRRPAGRSRGSGTDETAKFVSPFATACAASAADWYGVSFSWSPAPISRTEPLPGKPRAVAPLTATDTVACLDIGLQIVQILEVQ